jgi:hypothetical protein
MEGLETFRKSLEQELIRRTGRKDIEVTAGPWRDHDVHIAIAADGHPHVDFYSTMRWDDSRIDTKEDYIIP